VSITYTLFLEIGQESRIRLVILADYKYIVTGDCSKTKFASNTMAFKGRHDFDVTVKRRSSKLTDTQNSLILRRVSTLRTEEGNFSAASIVKRLGIDHDEAKSCKKHLPENFWTEHLPFLLDGTGFARKTNPCEQARVIKMEEDIRETCRLGCTSKGQEQGTGGRVLKHMVASSYGKGMVICEPYNENAWSVRFKFI